MKSHRILHILNRNITEEHKFSKEEITNAFLKKDYKKLTQREKLIYSRFFKECDKEDLTDLLCVFNLSIDSIKGVYKYIPERAFSGVSKIWDKEFKMEKE